MNQITDFVTGGALQWYGAASPGASACTDDAGAVLLPGSRLGPYRIGALIGRGGSSLVYRAERCDGAFSQTVAIKVARNGVAADAARLERDHLARLSHPFIARIFDAGVSDGTHWFAMEFVDGLPIDRYAGHRCLDWRSRLGLLQSVCAAIGQAHDLGLVHGDIKPSNVLVDREGNPRIIDFGIAQDLRGSNASSNPAWTAAYASPEQVVGDPVTVRSDIYQLGLLVRELLLEPVSPDPPATTPPLPAIARRNLETVVARACADDPCRRFEHASQLADDLSRVSRHRAAHAGGLTRWHRLQLLVRSRPFAVVAVAATLLAVVGATYLNRTDRQAAAARIAVEIQLAQGGRAFLSRALTQEPANTAMTSPLDRLDAAAARTWQMHASPATRVAALEALTDAYFDTGMDGPVRANRLIAATVAEFDRAGSQAAPESRARLATLLARCIGATSSLDAFRQSLHEAERLHREAGIDARSLSALRLGRQQMYLLEREGRLDDITGFATRLIDTADAALSTSSELARVLHRRGHFRWKHEEDPDALGDLQRAKHIFDTIYGPGHALTTTLTGVMAEIEATQGDIDAARHQLQATMDAAAAAFPAESIEVAQAHSVLGGFLVRWAVDDADIPTALDHLEPAYQTLSRLDRRFIGLSVGQDYAAALIETRKFPEAIRVLQAALEQRRIDHPDAHPYVVWTRLMLAHAECLAGDRESATASLDVIAGQIEKEATGRWFIYWLIRGRCLLRQGQIDAAAQALAAAEGAEPDTSSLARRLYRRLEIQLRKELSDARRASEGIPVGDG